MNLLLLILIIISSVFVNAKETFELKIEKITFNYLRAAELLENHANSNSPSSHYFCYNLK